MGVEVSGSRYECLRKVPLACMLTPDRSTWAETTQVAVRTQEEITVLSTNVSLPTLPPHIPTSFSDHLTGVNPLVVKLPTALPAGDYLVRAEHLAMHIANQPQFYIGCGQVTVTEGGNGTPGPLVAFPGAYHSGDKAIWNNFNYPKPVDYTPPGPPVWVG